MFNWLLRLLFRTLIRRFGRKCDLLDEAEEAALLRLYGVCLGIALFGIVPIETGNYFSNSAYDITKRFLTDDPDAGYWRLGLHLSMIHFGVLIGSLMVPYLGRSFGRPRCLLIAVGAFVLSGRILQLISVASGAWVLLILGRLLCNIALGILYTIAPAFFNEVAPPEVRSSIGVFFPVGMCLGSVFGAFLGVHWVLGSDSLWWLAVLLCLLLALPALPLLSRLPDTPPYLLAKHQDYQDSIYEDNARASLLFYQGTEERLEAHRADASYLQTESASMWSIFACPELRRQLKIALAVMSLYFPASLFGYSSTFALANAGLSESASEMVTLGLKLLALVVLLSSMYTGAFTHRRQLIVSAIITVVCMLLLGLFHGLITAPNGAFSWCFAVSLIVLQASVNFGIRQLYWVIVPELFPCRHRASGKAIVNAALGVLHGTLNLLFDQLLILLGGFLYVLLAIPIAGSLAYIWNRLPETGGNQELHQIYAQFQTMEESKEPLTSVPNPNFGATTEDSGDSYQNYHNGAAAHDFKSPSTVHVQRKAPAFS